MHEEKSLLKEDVELEAHISVKPPFSSLSASFPALHQLMAMLVISES